jgi:hypothetical protein
VSATDDIYTVYAISGDTFTRMRVSLRPDGSVSEDTDRWPVAEVAPGSVEGKLGSLLIGEQHPGSLVVPASVVDAVRQTRADAVSQTRADAVRQTRADAVRHIGADAGTQVEPPSPEPEEPAHGVAPLPSPSGVEGATDLSSLDV